MDVLGDFRKLANLRLTFPGKTSDKEILTCAGGASQNLRYCYVNRQLKFLHGSMPRLEDVCFAIRVCEVKRVSPDFDFNFGLLNLPAIQQVKVHIDCAYSRAVDVEEAEAALRHAVHMHPNSPTLEIRRFKEKLMLLMGEEYKEKNEVLCQMCIQKNRFTEIFDEIRDAEEMQAALAINHPILLETIPLTEHLTKDVVGPDAMEILNNDLARVTGMLTSELHVHGLEEQVAAARGHLKRVDLVIQQSTQLLEQIKVALKPLFLPPFLDQSEDSE